jgi:UDP-N-acetylmuramoyl-tripeptide--D-alanyl-D-alanine ligase
MRAFVWICYLVFATRRLLTYLHIFQQEEYDGVRFIRWIVGRIALDRRASALLLLAGVIESVVLVPHVVSSIVASGIFLGLAAFERDPRRVAKKHLVMTSRAKRTLWVALVLSAFLGAGVAMFGGRTWIWVIPVQIVPLLLVIANICLMPYEHRAQELFWREAHAKLLALQPTTVGITGSYGKTSVKHILGHILGSQAPVLITPGSVNTPMGVSRVIREQMGPHHRFFVCEMGAYGVGSIARLCRLVPPKLAVITAVGPAHYERFKTLDAVAQGKFELAEAAVARGGKVVVSEDVLRFACAQAFSREHPQAIVTVGTGPGCLAEVLECRQGAEGLAVDVGWDGKRYTLRARLFGEHHAINLAMSFAASCVLGMSPDDVVLAIASVPQISHRLEVKRQGSGPIIIDDAYNSNPVGFANGLRLLDVLRSNGGRRILVTPGMVELGALHHEEHQRIGALAAAHVDVLLAVLPDRIRSLVEAYREKNTAGDIISCATYADADRWLQTNLRSTDVVLLENDLPDLYERRINL